MYAKCGWISIAKEIFERLPVRDIVTQTALLIGYAEHGSCEETLKFFSQMKHEGFFSDNVTIICCLKAFGIIGALNEGCELHAEIESKGLLERDTAIGNSLVDMYIKCGLLSKAEEVFDKLPVRTTVSWNVLITGYSECGRREALDCLALMRLEGVSPNALTHLFSLKACGGLGSIHECQEIHLEIEKMGFFEEDSMFGSTLVDVYAKCKCLQSAQSVFSRILSKDVSSWTALIGAYSEEGYDEKAIVLFEKMQSEGVSPTASTYVCVMKACGSLGAFNKAKDLHMGLVQCGMLERELAVGIALVEMYAKCSSPTTAHHVFNNLPLHTVDTWTTLIAGYIENQCGKEALCCLDEMRGKGEMFDAVIFTSGLRACSMTNNVWRGLELYCEVERQGLLKGDLIIVNAIIDMYANCGLLSCAKECLDRFQASDVVSWNALISGYLKHSDSEKVIISFELMQQRGISPDATTYVHFLEACAKEKALAAGQRVHTEVVIWGFMEGDLLLSSALVDMYAKCGELDMAHRVFITVEDCDEVIWTALITGYVDHGYYEEALTCFRKMQAEGVLPNCITLLSCLKACVRGIDPETGQQLHAEIERQGLLEVDIILGNALIELYVKTGSSVKAEEVFKRLPSRDSVSWTTLMVGYIEQGRNEKALILFDKMKALGFRPTAITFICILKACTSLGDIRKGEKIHREIESYESLGSSLAICNSLINMYAGCGLLGKAKDIFGLLPTKNVASWAAIVSAYAEHKHFEEALEHFKLMQCKGVSLDAAVFIHALKSCSTIGAKEMGYTIHSEIEKHGLVENNLVVGNALIDAYASFGCLIDAQSLLYRLPFRDVVSWNTLMAGFARVGPSGNVFTCLGNMVKDLVEPDVVTFSVVLKACSREGLAAKSKSYYEAMSKDYGLIPDHEHLLYIIDVFGRSGQLYEAAVMIKGLEGGQRFSAWHSLLCASRHWGSLLFEQHAFEYSLHGDCKISDFTSNSIVRRAFERRQQNAPCQQSISDSSQEASTYYMQVDDNPRSWHVYPLKNTVVRDFSQKKEMDDLGLLVLHNVIINVNNYFSFNIS
ncbi:hypothetical protein KP509_04G007500 [Ceratopteris richardii]|nr:hypothetical protein KP509_04G007500 [Ceratopteris richardii]